MTLYLSSCEGITFEIPRKFFVFEKKYLMAEIP